MRTQMCMGSGGRVAVARNLNVSRSRRVTPTLATEDVAVADLLPTRSLLTSKNNVCHPKSCYLGRLACSVSSSPIPPHCLFFHYLPFPFSFIQTSHTFGLILFVTINSSFLRIDLFSYSSSSSNNLCIAFAIFSLVVFLTTAQNIYQNFINTKGFTISWTLGETMLALVTFNLIQFSIEEVDLGQRAHLVLEHRVSVTKVPGSNLTITNSFTQLSYNVTTLQTYPDVMCKNSFVLEPSVLGCKDRISQTIRYYS